MAPALFTKMSKEGTLATHAAMEVLAFLLG